MQYLASKLLDINQVVVGIQHFESNLSADDRLRMAPEIARRLRAVRREVEMITAGLTDRINAVLFD
jgi:hypothetical protein